MKQILFVWLLVLISINTYSKALIIENNETMLIEAESSYIIAKNENRVEATKIAVELAKLEAMEKSGAYYFKLLKTHNDQITQEHHEVVTSALMSVDIISNKTSVNTDGHLVITAKIKARIDQVEYRTKLKLIRDNKIKSALIKKLSKNNKDLKRELRDLAAVLKHSKAEWLRIKKQAVIHDINLNIARTKSSLSFDTASAKNQAQKLQARTISDVDRLIFLLEQNTEVVLTKPQITSNGDGTSNIAVGVYFEVGRKSLLVSLLNKLFSDSDPRFHEHETTAHRSKSGRMKNFPINMHKITVPSYTKNLYAKQALEYLATKTVIINVSLNNKFEAGPLVLGYADKAKQNLSYSLYLSSDYYPKIENHQPQIIRFKSIPNEQLEDRSLLSYEIQTL